MPVQPSARVLSDSVRRVPYNKRVTDDTGSPDVCFDVQLCNYIKTQFNSYVIYTNRRNTERDMGSCGAGVHTGTFYGYEIQFTTPGDTLAVTTGYFGYLRLPKTRLLVTFCY